MKQKFTLRRALSALLALALVLALLPAAALADAPAVVWAGAGNAAGNNQVVSAAMPTSADAIEQKWSYALNRTAASWGTYYAGQTVIVGDYLYAAGGGYLHKIALSDAAASYSDTTETKIAAGSSSWCYDYLCTDGQSIYVATESGIAAYALSDLSRTWTTAVSQTGQFHPVQYLAGGYLYCCGKLYSASTGAALTMPETAGSFSWSSGAAVGDYFYVASAKTLYAFAYKTGTVTLADSWDYAPASTASVAGGVAYAAGRLYWASYNAKTVYSVAVKNDGTLDTASELSKSVSQNSVCTPVVYNGRVYLAGQSGQVDVLSASTLGTIYTTAGIGAKIQGNPILCTAYANDKNDKTVYLYVQNYAKPADLYVLEDSAASSAGALTKLTSLATGSNLAYAYEQLAADSDGALYFFNEEGYLYKWGFGSASDAVKSSVAAPAVTANLSASAVSYAAGAKPAALSVTVSDPTDGGTLSYQWQQSAGGAGYQDIPGASGASYTPAETAGTVSYRVKIASTKAGVSSIVYSAATPVTFATARTAAVHVTISVAGELKLAQKAVTVSDRNGSGVLDIDDALSAAHEASYTGGAAAGYASSVTQYGLGITKLWGDTSGNYGYWRNNASAWSLSDAVSDGDYVTAFVYRDSGYADKYAYFTAPTAAATAGTAKTLTLQAVGYDASWTPVAAPYGGADVRYSADGGKTWASAGKTDASGAVSLTLPSAGTWLVEATHDGTSSNYASDPPIVPAVCTVTAAAQSGGTTGGSDVTVTFSLLGDTAHGEGGTVHTLRAGSLATWIAPESVTVPAGSSVGDVLKKALDAGGYTCVGLDKNYVSSVTSPSKITLAQGTNGANSGWMYTRNGKHPLNAVNDQKVSSGDVIVFHYTDDYNLEEGSPSSSGGSGTVSGSLPFKDVASGDWYYGAVAHVWGKSLFTGRSATAFDPNGAMTRAMLVTVLWRMEGSPAVSGASAFADVPAGAYYAAAVAWAAKNGIVTGVSAAAFDPDGLVTREQTAAILYRYAQYRKYDTTQGGMAVREYSDYDAISPYALGAMGWSVGAQLLKGSGGALTPRAAATRAQVAEILTRFDETIAK